MIVTGLIVSNEPILWYFRSILNLLYCESEAVVAVTFSLLAGWATGRNLHSSP